MSGISSRMAPQTMPDPPSVQTRMARTESNEIAPGTSRNHSEASRNGR
jgi:hypothetical protein